jgi:hypothetical protein
MQALGTLKRTDVRFKLVLMVFFGLFYALAIPYPQKSRQFPQLIALFSLVTVVISLISDFARKAAATGEIAQVDDTELTRIDEQSRKEKKGRFYRAWVIILASTVAGLLGGFAFTTFFLFAGFALVFGDSKDLFKNAVMTVAITVCIYLAFHWLMGVPLFSGIFW